VSEFFKTYDREVVLRETFQREGQLENMKITRNILDRMLHKEFLLDPSAATETNESVEDQTDLDVMRNTNDLLGYIASREVIVPLFEEEIR